MRKILPFILALMLGSVAIAQTPVQVFDPDDEPVFTVVDNEPEFPGGMDNLYQYIASNVQYPAKAKADKNEELRMKNEELADASRRLAPNSSLFTLHSSLFTLHSSLFTPQVETRSRERQESARTVHPADKLPTILIAVSCWLLDVSRQKPIANSQQPIANSQ